MGENRKSDFSGWATKNDLKCSDGRTIKAGAFKHMDKMTVPLVWMHQHMNPENVLGHAVLEDRAFGVYTHGYLNDTPRAQHMRGAIKNKDVKSLSIYANNLTERNKEVYHGDIKEVSLVLAGANPGAVIENINLVHGDSFETLDSEAIIHTGLDLDDSETINKEKDMTDDQKQEELQHAERTVKDVFEELTEEQKNVVYYMIGAALESAGEDDAEHGEELSGEDVLAHIDNKIQEGINEMTRNVFDQNGEGGSTLSHSDIKSFLEAAKQNGSFKDTLAHAADYGINDISLLFPDAKASGEAEIISRRMEWVGKVLGSTKHLPFAKVKSLTFDITADEARAKGYIKGNLKKDEVVQLLRRTTGPTTIYKKQKLDRDDMIDITDINVVAWLKAEIRLMLEEEIARAILIGDGRDVNSEDKIKDPAGSIDGNGIRSILNDHDLYAIKVYLDTNSSPKEAVKGLVRARTGYRGTGKPTLFVSDNFLTDIMLEEDKFGRPLYETEAVLADKLRVSDIVTVELFDDTDDLFAIMVNLADYSVGTNRGGELTSFEDFDIDYNQHKYLMETRLSGALTKPKSAIVVRRLAGTAATPTAPSFDGETDTITIPTVTGVSYTIDEEEVTAPVTITAPTEVVAVPDEGYYFAPGSTTSWTYTP